MNTRKHPQPVLTDSSLNMALSVKYIIYATFGISGMLTTIPSVTEVAGAVAAQALGGAIGVLGIMAAVSTLRAVKSAHWERVELYITIALVAFVSMYNVCLIYLTVHGSDTRVGLTIIATALLVMPVWRVISIIRKLRKQA